MFHENVISFIEPLGLSINGYRLFRPPFLIGCDFNHICREAIVLIVLYRNLPDNGPN